ncbi:MAG: hypothetical protein K6F49_02235 [Saccharofermentans sp.]|nr:hypothetical protein [Saccharofermentans sp.]
MDKKTLKTILDNLYDDMIITDREAVKLASFISSSRRDKNNILKKLYYSDNAPVKVLSTEFKGKGESDVTGEMIDVSVKYDEFIERLENRMNELIARHNKAMNVFFLIMSLPEPFCRVLYLKYFKRMTCDEVSVELYISPSTFYRKLHDGEDLLIKNINDKGEHLI